MNIAFLGCGYVANMYRLTLAMHPELNLVSVFDSERSRSENMARLTGARAASSLAQLLDDESIELVVNLASPESHFETTRQILMAGKHVYSEKPLALSLQHASALVALASEKELLLSSAPCTLMSEAAQTLWRVVNDGVVGSVRLVYAEMEDGMIHRAPLRTWVNEAGTAWPYVNEFETGCTVEHAGYVLSWLVAMFGRAVKVTAFSTTLVEEKMIGQVHRPADDYSVACIEFASGVVARMTNGIYAEHDHRMRLFGDEGVITVADPRSDRSKISIRKYVTLRRRRFLSPLKRNVALTSIGHGQKIVKYRGSQSRDFCRGLADMAAAIGRGGRPYLSSEFSLHINEITLACQNARQLALEGKMPYIPVTDPGKIQPMVA